MFRNFLRQGYFIFTISKEFLTAMYYKKDFLNTKSSFLGIVMNIKNFLENRFISIHYEFSNKTFWQMHNILEGGITSVLRIKI